MKALAARILACCAEETGACCRADSKTVKQLLQVLRCLLFPGYFRKMDGCVPQEVSVHALLWQARSLLQEQLAGLVADSDRVCLTFLEEIPRVYGDVVLDLQAFLEADPAAEGEEEILLSYPGFYAILVQRFAHILWQMRVPLLPRMMTEQAHSATGIDIHPGAVLGKSFFIDHGTGIVIGQTARIGDHVKIYQGVTLGALSTRGGQSLRGKKRHPTLEDGVTVYAGASILGGDTVIGKGATIGANAFVTGSVEPGAVVIGHRPGP